MKKITGTTGLFCLVSAAMILQILALCITTGQAQPRRVLKGQKESTVVNTSSQAPTGTYLATTGSSATTQGAGGQGRLARRAATTGATAGGTVTINIGSYSPSSELQSVANAPQGNIAATIKGMPSKGSVMIGGQTFQINLASSVQVGSSYVIYLLSAVPFSASGPQGGKAQGGAVGMIELTMPSGGGAGTGKMYSSTQVAVGANGSVTSHAGASTATAFTSVTKS